MKLQRFYFFIFWYFTYASRLEAWKSSVTHFNVRDFLVEYYKRNYIKFFNTIQISSGFLSHTSENQKKGEFLSIQHCKDDTILLYLTNFPTNLIRRDIYIVEEDSGKIVDKRNYKIINTVHGMYVFLNLNSSTYIKKQYSFQVKMKEDIRLAAFFETNLHDNSSISKSCHPESRSLLNKNEIFMSTPFNIPNDDTAFFIICALKQSSNDYNIHFKYKDKKTKKYYPVTERNDFFKSPKNIYKTMIFIPDSLVGEGSQKFKCCVEEHKIEPKHVGEVTIIHNRRTNLFEWLSKARPINKEKIEQTKRSNIKDFLGILIIVMLSIRLFGSITINFLQRAYFLTFRNNSDE